MVKRSSTLWVAAAVAAALLAVILAWILFVPAADWLAQHDVGNSTGASMETARNDARGNLLALSAGLAGFGALIFTARNFALQRRTLQLAEEGQRRTQKLDIRIGGIYALERIARDSVRDHPTVMEVLTTFVRQHSPASETHAVTPTSDVLPIAGPQLVKGDSSAQRVQADIQAALTVIARRERQDTERIDLRDANLSRTNLIGANLAQAYPGGADLGGADLRGANLRGAYLVGAYLAQAYLTNADLTGANLTVADLTRADLECAILTRANLTSANLTRALLADANLSRANLGDLPLGNGGANLTQAYLTNADLTDARLRGADLSGAVLRGADLTGAYVERADAGGLWETSTPIPTGWRAGENGRLERDPTAEDA